MDCCKVAQNQTGPKVVLCSACCKFWTAVKLPEFSESKMWLWLLWLLWLLFPNVLWLLLRHHELWLLQSWLLLCWLLAESWSYLGVASSLPKVNRLLHQ